jgi:hypothetical protein
VVVRGAERGEIRVVVAAARGAEHHVMRVEVPLRRAARHRAEPAVALEHPVLGRQAAGPRLPGTNAVVEHGFERGARGRSEATLHRAEAGAEEAGDVRGHIRDPDISLFAAHVFGTEMHTHGELGKVGQPGRVEAPGHERVIHVVFEAAQGDLRRALDPGWMERARTPRARAARAPAPGTR